MGKFIVVEGLDGAGKSTQIELLQKYFNNNNLPYKFIHFPRTEQDYYGDLIAKYLRGEFGEVSAVHPQLVALLFAGDRHDFSETIKAWLKEGYNILADRYVNSNIAFQCAKVKDSLENYKLKSWINSFEYEHNAIPKPDISFFLDVPFDFIRESLNTNRIGEDREYLNGKSDIHETDLELQKLVRDQYLNLAKEQSDFVIINCADQNGCMLNKTKIHGLIIEAI